MAKASYDYDLIVIGSGPAGSLAAESAARAGKRVAIIEQGVLGGSAPTVGDVPLQALLTAAHAFDEARRAAAYGIRTSTVGYNYPSIKNWKDLVVKRSGVASTGDYLRGRGISVFRGRAHFLSPNQLSIGRRHLSAEKILIATGASPTIPTIPGLDTIDYVTAETAVDLIRPPKTLLVIGAGATGVQLAELFAIFGTKVYLLEAKKRILPEQDDEVSEALSDIFRRQRGMEIITSASIVAVKQESPLTRVNYLSGEHEHSIKVEKVLVTAGWSPNIDIGLDNAGIDHDRSGIRTNEYLATSSRHIFAAGAVTGRSVSTQAALGESKVVARNLWSRTPVALHRPSLPQTTWTSPEIAIVGATEIDLVREDIKFHRSVVLNNAITRANVANFGLGFGKVLTDTKGTLLGATIMAPHAAETITAAALAIDKGLTAYDIAELAPPFGSWAEALRLACARVR